MYLTLTKYKPFCIDLEDIVFWLDTRKDYIKDTLINSYSENIDYCYIDNKEKNIKKLVF